MLDTGHDLSFGGGVAGQFVGNDHSWDVLQAYAQLAEEFLGCVLVAPTLYQDIQDVAVLIHSSPQIGGFAVDFQVHAHPGATYLPFSDDDVSTHWRTSGQISDTTA